MSSVRAFAALLAVGVTAGCSRSSSPRQAFADRIRARIGSSHPSLRVTDASGSDLRIRRSDGTEATANLDNLRASCEHDSGGCDATVDAFLLDLELPIAADEGLQRAHLRPVLRDLSFVELLRKKAQQSPPQMVAANTVVARPFVGDLWITYVIDMPSGMLTVTRQMLGPLALTESELNDLAMKNLAAALPRLSYQPVEGMPAVRQAIGDADYESSRVLLHDLWAPIAHQVGGDLLVSVPARGIVLFTGSADVAAVGQLRELARNAAEKGDRPISPTVLLWTQNGWGIAP